MTSDLTDRLKQKVLESSTQESQRKSLSYPESNFQDFYAAGLCKPFTTRIPVSTIKALEVLTEATGESRSQLVDALIIEALKTIAQDKNMAHLKEAMITEANTAIQKELDSVDEKAPRRRQRRPHTQD